MSWKTKRVVSSVPLLRGRGFASLSGRAALMADEDWLATSTQSRNPGYSSALSCLLWGTTHHGHCRLLGAEGLQ